MNNKKKITLAASIASLFMLILYLINKLTFLAATMKETLFSKNGSYYSWRFGKIFYTKQGEGSPLLLIHDLTPSSSDYEWKETLHRLKKNHTVYTLDLLGCGRSEKPKMTYTAYLYVQLITDFCKQIIKEPADVAVTGHSSQAVLMACSIESGLFRNIILINPEDLSETKKIPGYKHKILQFILNIPIIGTFIYNIAVSKKLLEEQFKYCNFGSRSVVPSRFLDAYYESAHLGGSSSKYLYSSIKCHYTNISISRAVQKIDNTIILFGGQSVPKIKKIMEQYTSLNLSIEPVLLKNCGHLPQLEFPQYFSETLEIYLK